jgi:hypothetical protein
MRRKKGIASLINLIHITTSTSLHPVRPPSPFPSGAKVRLWTAAPSPLRGEGWVRGQGSHSIYQAGHIASSKPIINVDHCHT